MDLGVSEPFSSHGSCKAMKKIVLPIYLVTALLVLLTIFSQIDAGWAAKLVITVTSLSPLPIIWMVLRVLKDGEPSEYTFEERFYEDYDVKGRT